MGEVSPLLQRRDVVGEGGLLRLFGYGFPGLALLRSDPTTGAGVRAPVGSLGLRNNAGVGELWLKTSASDTGWTQVTVP